MLFQDNVAAQVQLIAIHTHLQIKCVQPVKVGKVAAELVAIIIHAKYVILFVYLLLWFSYFVIRFLLIDVGSS